MEYPENAILDMTRNTYQHFYDGSEIVVAGRLVDKDMNNFKADVKGHGVSWAGPDMGWEWGNQATMGCVYGLMVQQWPSLNRATWLQTSIPYASRLLPPLPQALTDLTFTEEVDLKEMEKALQEQDYIFGSYIERLWAYLTIEQLLDKR